MGMTGTQGGTSLYHRNMHGLHLPVDNRVGRHHLSLAPATRLAPEDHRSLIISTAARESLHGAHQRGVTAVDPSKPGIRKGAVEEEKLPCRSRISTDDSGVKRAKILTGRWRQVVWRRKSLPMHRKARFKAFCMLVVRICTTRWTETESLARFQSS